MNVELSTGKPYKKCVCHNAWAELCGPNMPMLKVNFGRLKLTRDTRIIHFYNTLEQLYQGRKSNIHLERAPETEEQRKERLRMRSEKDRARRRTKKHKMKKRRLFISSFLFCFLNLQPLNVHTKKNTRNELAWLVMGTIFVVICVIILLTYKCRKVIDS